MVEDDIINAIKIVTGVPQRASLYNCTMSIFGYEKKDPGIPITKTVKKTTEYVLQVNKENEKLFLRKKNLISNILLRFKEKI